MFVPLDEVSKGQVRLPTDNQEAQHIFAQTFQNSLEQKVSLGKVGGMTAFQLLLKQ